jgi:predicted metal-dependent phosphoesterase TrpH
LAPAEVVTRAARAGVRLLALTDHDTVAGVAEAAAAAREHGIGLVPAVELSSVHHAHEDLHVLGYAIDPAALEGTLADYREDRVRRIHAMADRLRELGFELDDAPLRRPAPGRPHLAQALLEHPANASRLRSEGIDGRDALFPAYLIPGAPAYVPRTRPTVAEAIAAVHAAGGLAVWAHPYWDMDDALPSLAEFAAHGLDGVEAFYITHDERQTRALYAAAMDLGLLTTGSADFHGPGHERFDRFRNFSLHGLTPLLGPLAGYYGR